MTTARDRILDYFVQDPSRTLSVAQAKNFFRIQQVTARISELRTAGHDIRTTMKEGRDGVSRAVYSFVIPTKGRRRVNRSTSR